MAKLVNIGARHIKKWPINAEYFRQDPDGEICFMGNGSIGNYLFPNEMADDNTHDGCIGTLHITRAQWVIERVKILLDKQPERDPEISKAVDAISGKTKEDQELWDKVAIAAIPIFYQEYMTDHRNGSSFLYKDMMEDVAECADAFMAERAKRLGASRD